MILVDTSVWADHLDRKGHRLGERLQAGDVLIHPLVIGELACGNLTARKETLQHLKALPRVVQASDEEALTFLERHVLAGSGLGIVDIHLLASATLTQAVLWTSDKPLERAARKCGVQLMSEAA